jgi:hypothetical protein
MLNLTNPLPLADLSPSELRAMTLDGEVWALGRQHIPISTPLDFASRLSAATPLFTDGLVVVGLAAAWVWGCMTEAPIRWEVARADGSRVGIAIPTDVRIRDLIWGDRDIVHTRTGMVSSVVRTVLDLARYESGLPESRILEILRNFELTQNGALNRARSRLNESAHLPYKDRAISRLRAASS